MQRKATTQKTKRKTSHPKITAAVGPNPVSEPERLWKQVDVESALAESQDEAVAKAEVDMTTQAGDVDRPTRRLEDARDSLIEIPLLSTPTNSEARDEDNVSQAW